jgi:hypothetical protein
MHPEFPKCKVYNTDMKRKMLMANETLMKSFRLQIACDALCQMSLSRAKHQQSMSIAAPGQDAHL